MNALPTSQSHPIPLSLYIHIPWCIKKCPYCDFNSHEIKNPTTKNSSGNTKADNSFPEAEYILALLDDLKQDKKHCRDRPIETIFFGGGTPGLLSVNGIQKLLEKTRSIVQLAEDCEITLEANPGATDAGKFPGFINAGVNRLSIGIQSFNNEHLGKLGRIHSASEAEQAFIHARDSGFNNINVDLMYGLPGQTKQQALDDLHQAIALQPDHISWYQLTIEPNTVFYSRTPLLPADIIIEDIEITGRELLQANGYQQYEISAYAKHGRECRHNINYWEFADYLGIGAGAHGKISDPNSKEIIRYNKTRLPSDYLDKSRNRVSSKKISSHEVPLEFMMNALRLKAGVPSGYYPERSFASLETISPVIQSLCEQGLMMNNKNRLQPTARGFDFLNHVLSQFDN